MKLIKNNTKKIKNEDAITKYKTFLLVPPKKTGKGPINIAPPASTFVLFFPILNNIIPMKSRNIPTNIKKGPSCSNIFKILS